MNKTVLITGASRGIGRETAILFAKNNYNVVINYLNNKSLANSLKESLEARYNIKVLTIKADISKEEEVQAMVADAIEEFKKIDVLVNNASIAKDNILELKTKEEFASVININLVGTFLVTKEVSKYMKKERDGVIINVSSTNAIDSYYPYSMDYDASKAGVISLTMNFAVELSPYIRVNAVAPGWVNTDMNKEIDINYKKDLEEKILLNRFAEPTEVAKVIYFLASDDASYINGEVIKIDGGRRKEV